jgi:hypothetical protein
MPSAIINGYPESTHLHKPCIHVHTYTLDKNTHVLATSLFLNADLRKTHTIHTSAYTSTSYGSISYVRHAGPLYMHACRHTYIHSYLFMPSIHTRSCTHALCFFNQPFLSFPEFEIHTYTCTYTYAYRDFLRPHFPVRPTSCLYQATLTFKCIFELRLCPSSILQI